MLGSAEKGEGMARHYGAAGRFAKGKANNMLIIQMVVLYVTTLFLGVALGWALPRGITSFTLILYALVGCIGLALFWFLRKWTKTMRSWEKGTYGEVAVGSALVALPEAYSIIHDIKLPASGNIDHVLLGPKGVFLVETKWWRGTVALDLNQSDLLLNGTRKDILLKLRQQIRNIPTHVPALSTNKVRVYGMAVFPISYVEGQLWGKTGEIYCMTDETVERFIDWFKPERTLGKEDIERIRKDFLALAASNPR